MREHHRSPAVRQLVEDFTEQIRSGKLRPGDYLPSAHSLAESYDIGYTTVIRAYKTLSEAGLIETVQGRGAFVRHSHEITSITEITVVLPSQDILSQTGNPHSDWVFHELLAGMNGATLARGIRLHLHFADNIGAQWPAICAGLRGGVLFVLQAPPPWVLRLERLRIPYALVLPMMSADWEAEIPCSAPDFFGGVHAAVTAVLKTGRTRAAYVGETAIGTEGPRYDGCVAALAETGGTLVETIPCPEISRAAGRKAIESYLAEHPVPDFDLLVAANDNRALGALEALSAHGLRVPEDIAVLGFDDIPAAADAGLSTVHLPMRDLGEASLHWLLDTVAPHPGAEPPHLTLPCPVVWRGSTG
ncbi:MAG TPA: substrate-binding domain-containing protein [Armatimonadota bacterium]|jgi:DNA-binding LacI/PurR family transcriptional regulator